MLGQPSCQDANELPLQSIERAVSEECCQHGQKGDRPAFHLASVSYFLGTLFSQMTRSFATNFLQVPIKSKAESPG